jgi:hypothetical protein
VPAPVHHRVCLNTKTAEQFHNIRHRLRATVDINLQENLQRPFGRAENRLIRPKQEGSSALYQQRETTL